MSTKTNVLNDAFIPVAVNVEVKDAIARLLITMGCLAILMTAPPIPIINILMVTAVYMFSTALISWDPLYALIGIRLHQEGNETEIYNEGSVSFRAGSQGAEMEANEIRNNECEMKKAG